MVLCRRQGEGRCNWRGSGPPRFWQLCLIRRVVITKTQLKERKLLNRAKSKSTCTQSSHSPLPSRPLSTLHDKGHSALTIERQSLLGARKNSLLFLLRRLIFQDIFLTYTCAGIHDRIILGKHILRNKMIKATGAF